MLIRQARLVPIGSGNPPADGPVDVRVDGGRVAEVAPGLDRRAGEDAVDAGGRWLIPGLWDAHVHLALAAQSRLRLDVSAARSPQQAARLVADRLAARPVEPGQVLVGTGYRAALWERQPTSADLDAVCGDQAVVLVCGDVHSAWLSSAAFRLLGRPPTDVLTESDWFDAAARLQTVPEAGLGSEALQASLVEIMGDAARRGVVGVVDMETAGGHLSWPRRVAAGADRVRVRVATRPDGLDDVISARLRTGDPLPGAAAPAGGDPHTGLPADLVTMGPLKIISDGSLNTRTAYCCEPYPDAVGSDRGTRTVPPAELVGLMARAHAHGLQVAVHAIGDQSVADAVTAFAATGARGSVEHAQLTRPEDLQRMARHRIVASVQPAHLLDDRPATQQYWPDRAHRCFMFRSMLDAGVRLALGSDAPVAPLDPWLAMSAAVGRTPPGDDDAWNPAESITAAEALAASTDGRETVSTGDVADLVLLDDDPLAADPVALRAVRAALTLVAGRITHTTV